MAEQFGIVTGASSGIGFSLAKELAARGYDLAICSGQRLQTAADELRSQCRLTWHAGWGETVLGSNSFAGKKY